ncbi:MAG: hypothetical protein ACK5U4_02335 [Rhodospirillales bacterium]
MNEPFDKRFSRLLAEKFVERLRADGGFIDLVREYFSTNHHEQPPQVVKFWTNLTSEQIDVLCSRIMAPTDEGGFARETLPPLLDLTSKERAEMIASARASMRASLSPD